MEANIWTCEECGEENVIDLSYCKCCDNCVKKQNIVVSANYFVIRMNFNFESSFYAKTSIIGVYSSKDDALEQMPGDDKKNKHTIVEFGKETEEITKAYCR